MIRSLRVGDVFQGKLITVGQTNSVAGNQFKVESIVHDEAYLADHGLNKYDVFVKDVMGWGKPILWQSFINQPVSITYECAN